jgi:hypothetical protein
MIEFYSKNAGKIEYDNNFYTLACEHEYYIIQYVTQRKCILKN